MVLGRRPVLGIDCIIGELCNDIGNGMITWVDSILLHKTALRKKWWECTNKKFRGAYSVSQNTHKIHTD